MNVAPEPAVRLLQASFEVCTVNGVLSDPVAYFLMHVVMDTADTAPAQKFKAQVSETLFYLVGIQRVLRRVAFFSQAGICRGGGMCAPIHQLSPLVTMQVIKHQREISPRADLSRQKRKSLHGLL